MNLDFIIIHPSPGSQTLLLANLIANSSRDYSILQYIDGFRRYQGIKNFLDA